MEKSIFGTMGFDQSQGYGSFSYGPLNPDYSNGYNRLIPFWGTQPYKSLSHEQIKQRRAGDFGEQNNQKRFLLVDLGPTIYYWMKGPLSEKFPDFDQPWRAGEAFWRMEGSCSDTVLGGRFIW